MSRVRDKRLQFEMRVADIHSKPAARLGGGRRVRQMHKTHGAPVSPRAFMRLTLLVLVGGGLFGVVALFYMVHTVDETTKRATQRSSAAVLLSQTQNEMDDVIAMMNTRSETFLASQEVTALLPEERAALRVELNRQDSDTRTQILPHLLITFSTNEALTFQRTIDSLLTKAQPLFDSMTQGERLDGLAKLRSATAAIDQYYRQPNVLDFRIMRSELSQIRNLMKDSVPVLLAAARADQAQARSATNVARWGLLASIVAIVGVVLSLIWLLARRIQAYVDRYATERDELSEATERLQYRNTQLNALYNVFSEITDTLSLPYVVSATTREALRVMNANMAVLRLLKGNELIAVGNLTSEGVEVEDLPPVKLGEGPTGRAAKRGKTVRIHNGAQELLGPIATSQSFTPAAQNANAGVQSGMVVPLIVGARVVGTLACWSRDSEAFNEEDEKVLEMMASQVATAVVVADTTEASEHRAHHDALTGLPNRLQLSKDLAGDLAELDLSGRRAVVAMADIDHFKEINDEFGHQVGDVSLQKVAHILRSTVRTGDRVYRYGGEEFVIVFLDCDAAAGQELADRVRLAVESTPLTGDNLEPVGPVTMSIGLASLPDHGADIEALIGLADEAMYCAKDLGRNRVILYGAAERTVSRVA
jgi:diguanylate cyclase (GGDEF)-like protein